MHNSEKFLYFFVDLLIIYTILCKKFEFSRFFACLKIKFNENVYNMILHAQKNIFYHTFLNKSIMEIHISIIASKYYLLH